MVEIACVTHVRSSPGSGQLMLPPRRSNRCRHPAAVAALLLRRVIRARRPLEAAVHLREADARVLLLEADDAAHVGDAGLWRVQPCHLLVHVLLLRR